MNKSLMSIMFVLMAIGFASAASFNQLGVTPGSDKAGDTTYFNFTINVTTDHENMTAITFGFPSGFDVSTASVTSSSGISGTANTVITGQNVTYNFSNSTIAASAALTIGISSIRNHIVSAVYPIIVTSFDVGSIEDSGVISNYQVNPNTVSNVQYYYSGLTPTAGAVFTGQFSSQDRYGNFVYTDTYNYSTSDTLGTMPANGTINFTNANFYLYTAGSRTIAVTSGSNSTASNVTTFTVSPAGVTKMIPIYTAAQTAGSAFNIQVYSLDRFGNINYADRYNFSSTDALASVPANLSINLTNLATTLRTAGSSTISVTSLINGSATNGTLTFTVSPGTPVNIINTFSSSTVTAGVVFTGTFYSVDSFGNVAYSDIFNFSSSDTAAVLPTNPSANLTQLNFDLRTSGSKTITVTSNTNSSITNTSTFTVLPASISKMKSIYTSAATAGTPFNIAIYSTDKFDNVNYTDTYDFNISDSSGTAPANVTANYTLVSATLVTAGTRTITAFSQKNSSATNGTLSFTVSPDGVTKMIPIYTAAQTAGSAFNIQVYSLDRFGNYYYADRYNFSSSDALATLPANLSINLTNLATTLRTAGAQTITVTSLVNGTAANGTLTFVVSPASEVYSVQATFSTQSVTAGTNFTATITSKDSFGNLVSDTYNFGSSDTQAMFPGNGTTNGTGKGFQLRTGGSKTITVWSATNASATNVTSFNVSAASTPATIQVVLTSTNIIANTAINATITSKDAYGNFLQDNYTFTSSDTQAVLPTDTITQNGTNKTFWLRTSGSQTFVVTSVTNTSASNSSTVTVNASTVTRVIISPLAPSKLAGGDTQQFTALLKDAYNNTNTTVVAVFTATNLTGNGSINTSGFFTTAAQTGLVQVMANYSGILNYTNVTVYTDTAPTATPTPSSGGGTGGNPGGSTTPSATPTPVPTTTPTPVPTPTKVPIGTSSTVSVQTSSSTSIVTLTYDGGSRGFDGDIQFTVPGINYADYAAGNILISVNGGVVKKVESGSLKITIAANLAPQEQLVAKITVPKQINPESVTKSMKPPIVFRTPTYNPSSTPKPTVAPTKKPSATRAPVGQAVEGANNNLVNYGIFLVLLIIGGYALFMSTQQKKTKGL